MHKLIIKALHDAQAECSCGCWHYARTGAMTKQEIETEFKKHTIRPDIQINVKWSK